MVHHTKSQSIAAQLAQQARDDQVKAQSCLMKMISCLQFITCQGLPSRGHGDAEGNFLRLLQLCCSDCSFLKEWISQHHNWTSHDIQNEIFEITAHTVLHKLTILIGSTLFSLMKPQRSPLKNK